MAHANVRFLSVGLALGATWVSLWGQGSGVWANESPSDVVRKCITEALAGRDITDYAAKDGRLPPLGAGCHQRAITSFAVRSEQRHGSSATVTVDVQLIFAMSCTWSEYYFPSKKGALIYRMRREAPDTGGPAVWKVEYTDYALFPASEVRRIQSQPLYCIIAGCFRSEAGARRHCARASEALGGGLDEGVTVLASRDFEGLSPGYFIVVPKGSWQFQYLTEARALCSWIRGQGVDSYVKRVR